METSAESDQQSEKTTPVVAEPQVESTGDPAASGDESAKQPAPKNKRKGQSLQSSKNSKFSLRQATARFAGCGRCSYLWAGYRVLFGQDAQETAVAQSESGWLDLTWNQQMPELVYKSYGIRLDISHFYYAGCCKECRRPFVYRAPEAEEKTGSFKIGISPRTSKAPQTSKS